MHNYAIKLKIKWNKIIASNYNNNSYNNNNQGWEGGKGKI